MNALRALAPPPAPVPQRRIPDGAAGTAPSYFASVGRSGTEQKSSRATVNAPFAGEGARAQPPLLELLEATKLVGIDSCARIAGLWHRLLGRPVSESGGYVG
jgi:hypothetical protein